MELPLAVRLDQIAVEPGGQARGFVAARRARGQGDDGRGRGALFPLAPPDGGHGRVAVHLRHLQVHQHHVEPLGRARRHRRGAVGLDPRGVALPLEEADRHPLIGDRVFDQQHAQRPDGGELAAGRRRFDGAGRGKFQAGRAMERAARPRLAAEADVAAEGLHEARGDRQPQARAPVAPRRRRVGLHELVEDDLLLVGRNADAGVGHLEPQHDAGAARLVAPDAQDDPAPLRELHGVREQVRQDLPQQAAVADQRVRHIVLDLARQRDVPAAEPGRERLHQRVEPLAQTERARLEDQLAGLDLREVENVVDDVEQRLGRFAHGVELVVLRRGQVGLAQQLGHPDHAVERRADLVAHVG